ncbi:MAG: hypothetical protein N2316_02350 [Spirochaetes bacterium]|nr:hypothetical protein [Spirochaetota bacterium]
MKRLINLIVCVSIIGYAKKAFAFIDGGLIGGYTFYGTIEVIDDEYKHVQGYQYSAFGHLNLNAEIFLLGFGCAFQSGMWNYKINSETQDFTLVSSFGPDIIFMLKISATTRPFGRIGFSLFDRLKYDYGEEFKNKIRFLNSGWISMGVGQLVGEHFIMFVELQRYATRMNQDHSLRRYMVNVGIMFAY